MQKVRLVFTLRHPDQVEWASDPDFDVANHPRLLVAAERIRLSTPSADSRLAVEAELLAPHFRQMSQRQAMLRYYLLAQCARAHDPTLASNFAQALEWCSRAEQIAASLLDYGAQVDLHELRGTLHRAISMYWIAAEEFSYALRLLREHAEDTESFEPEFEVTLAAKAATLDYLLGNFSRALEHVRRAAALLPLTTTSVAGEGTVAWTFALLHRQRNEPVQALSQVKTAADLYRKIGATDSTCRVLSLAADIALDAAESSAGELPAARDGYLAIAADYVEQALQIGHEADDLPGIELAKLSRARLHRMQDLSGAPDAAASIRSVLRQARRMRDESLLTAAQTAWGVDLLACGDKAAGQRWLKKAIATAERISAPGLAYRAQRVLRQTEGRNV